MNSALLKKKPVTKTGRNLTQQERGELRLARSLDLQQRDRVVEDQTVFVELVAAE